MKSIIGRVKQRQLFQEILDGSKSEFMAFFGRRRIGKTFLIREFFDGEFDFQLTGLVG